MFPVARSRPRLRPLTAAALLALFALVVVPASAREADPVAAASRRARGAFAAGLREVDATLVSATKSLTTALSTGAKTPAVAANDYGGAFTFFAGQVKKTAEEAVVAFETEVAGAIVESGDPTLAGTLAGEGRGVDAFVEALQSALGRARVRALRRARSFARKLTAGAARAQMNVVVPPWTLDRTPSPTLPGVVPATAEQIRLLAAVAARLDDGHVVVAAGGRAPPSVSGDFDVRLLGPTGTVAVGPLLSAGGVTVTGDGTWSVVSTANDPTNGETVDAGNRVLAFGVEPFDGGLAGRQPGRFLRGGVIGVP